MDINSKMLADLAGQIGLDGKNSGSAKNAARAAEQYKGKSEEELLKEIMNLKRSMKSDKAAYQKQMKAIKSLAGMMNAEQRKRLDRVIRLLESE